jgi:hypothetical protein
MASAPDPKLSGFVRSAIVEGGRTLVRSICIHCGKEIVGSVTEGLPQLEADHLEREHGMRRNDTR